MADVTDTGSAVGRLSDEAARRRQKLLDGLETLRVRSGISELWQEKTLFVIGGVMAPLGLLLIFFGWMGAANTPYLFEQVPYLISGGLIGLGLMILGGLFYFAHWITELVKEQRRQTDALVEALHEIRDNDALLEAIAELNATLAKSNGRSATRRRTAKR